MAATVEAKVPRRNEAATRFQRMQLKQKLVRLTGNPSWMHVSDEVGVWELKLAIAMILHKP